MRATATPRIEDLVERSFEHLDALVRAKTAELRAAQRDLGPALAAIERKAKRDGLTALGVTSLSIYMESRGLSPGEGFAMRSAAEACQHSPAVAKAVEERKLSVPKAALLKDMLTKPELQRPDEDLVAAAQELTTKEFRNELNKRKAQARLPDKPVARTLFFSRAGVSALVRTRELVSSARKRSVSESEAAETALSEFVFRNDPEQKALRAKQRRERREARERRGRTASGDRAAAQSGGAAGNRTTTRADDAQRTGNVPRCHKAQRNGEASRIGDAPRTGKTVRSDDAQGDGDAPRDRKAPRDGEDLRDRKPRGTATDRNGMAARSGAAPAPGRASRDGQAGASDRRNSRYIPAEDRHRVIARFGDRCWVAGCDDRSRQTLAHGKPYRFGGSNRSWNLARYCLDHHRQFDGGQWEVVVSGENALLIDRRGLVVGKLRGLPPQSPRAPPP